MTKRIAMWSGPRNISTTMMRSFENRPDCTVIDEPFYAHYLTFTGHIHPMQEEILHAQAHDAVTVIKHLTQTTTAPVMFQKHMCQHITAEVGTDWMSQIDHFFLIRDPARMVASFADRMETVAPEMLGLEQEVRLFEHIADKTGKTPLVLDATDILARPRQILTALCARLNIPFYDAMLKWPAGPRETDGVWAPHWYKSVHHSTGFQATKPRHQPLTADLQAVVEACQPHYQKLYHFRLSIS